MPVYKVGEDIYNIPEDKVNEFKTAFPNAVLEGEDTTGKQTPQIPGASVEETAAPDVTDSKPVESSSASQLIKYDVDGQEYEIPENLTEDFLKQFPNAEEKKPGFWNQLFSAFKGGSVSTEIDDYTAKAFLSDKYAKNLSDEDAQKLLELWQEQDGTELTEGEVQWDKDYDLIAASNPGIVPDWFAGAVGATMRNPEAALLYGARSFAMMFSKENLGTATAGAATTAGVGLALGSVAPGVGNVVGGVGGAIKGFMGGLGAGVELFNSFGETIKESLPENYTIEDIQKAFADEELLTRARNRSAARAGTILAFDTIGAGFGGKAASQVGKQALKKGISKKAGALAGGLAEGAITSTSEFTGELAAQKAAGDEVDFKEAVLEVFGVSPSAIPGQIATAGSLMQSPKYKIDGREVSRKELNQFIDDNDGIDLAKIQLDVENDKLLQEKMQEKKATAHLKIQVAETITDDATRTKVAELEYEKLKLANNKTRIAKNRVSEINAEIDAIAEANKPKKGRPTKEVADRKAVIRQEADILRKSIEQASVAKTTQLAEQAKQFGIETVAVDDADQFKKEAAKSIASKGKKIPTELLSKASEIGGIAVGNKIIINKEVAAATGQITVGSHEVLHPIINAKIKTDKDLVKIINEFKQEMISSKSFTEDQINEIETIMDERGYRGDSVRAREFFNVFSDAINDKNSTLQYNENLFTKIGDFIVEKVLRPLGFKQIGFENGKQVYQFMKEYQKSIDKGEFTKGVKEAVGVIDPADLERGVQMSRIARETIDDAGKMSQQEWQQGGSEMAIADTFEILEPLIRTKITSAMRELPGFSEEDLVSESLALMLQHIRNFNPDKNDSLYGWITSQVHNKVKQALKKGNVTEEQFTSDVTEIRESTMQDFEMFAEDEFEFDQDDGDQLSGLINPMDFLDSKGKEALIGRVRELLSDKKEIDKLTFKKLGDIAPEITELYTKIPAKKLTNPASNLTESEISYMQAFVKENADTIIKLLPEGAILEAASEKLIGTGTGVPRKLLQSFYIKEERITKGAGLSPFKKDPNLTKEELFAEVGIKPDGTMLPFGGKDERAQRLFALARLLGKLTTNTAVRVELANMEYNQNKIVDIGAGRSEFHYSRRRENPNTYQTKLSGGVTVHRKKIKLTHGLSDAQIDELEKASAKVSYTKNNVTYYDLEQIGKSFEIYEKFGEFLPPELAATRGLMNRIVGKDYFGFGVGMFYGYIQEEQKFGIRKQENKVAMFGDRPATDAEIEAVYKNNKWASSASYRNKGFDKAGGEYSSTTINILNNLKEAFKKAGITDGKIPMLNRTRKTNLYKELNEAKDQKAFNKVVSAWIKSPDNKVREFALELQYAAAHDFLKTLNTPEEKLAALIAFKRLYASSYTINQGRKASLPITRIDYSEDGVYYPEHIKSMLEVETAMFSNLLRGTYRPSKAEMWIIPKKLQLVIDKGGLKTAPVEVRKTAYNEAVEEASVASFSRARKISPTKKTSINKMASRAAKVGENDIIGEALAKRLGEGKGRWSFFIPPSADDFMGLMYKLLGKGKVGDAEKQFIQERVLAPYTRAITKFETYKQQTLHNFREFKKLIRKTPANLNKKNSTGFTNEEAVRVWMWTEKGYSIPGLSNQERLSLVNAVNTNKDLKAFGQQMLNLLEFGGIAEPQENWVAGTLTTDIFDHINETARSEFMQPWVDIIEAEFGKFDKRGELKGDAINKMRAAFGNNYVEALSDVVWRMKHGRSREFGKNKHLAMFTNWVNNAVGTVMFFNTRSAVLQLISFTNFVNWEDNNPVAAGKAFADQKQYWEDFAMIFNSDFLKQRRSGLKTDVQADAIAKAADQGGNKFKNVVAAILKQGFLPTQMADSTAIAAGGASFYRNRLNRYLAEGMTKEEAEKKAFLEFKEIAEETQQSSRADRISMQQAGGIGRTILAFANTPMQYARLSKKAALDLLNGRGSAKANVSKMLYYGVLQNILFTYLQSALFAFALRDDDDKEKDEEAAIVRSANSMADGLLRGLGMWGAIAAVGKNGLLELYRQETGDKRLNEQSLVDVILTISPPMSSKAQKLKQAERLRVWKQNREKLLDMGDWSIDNPKYKFAGLYSSVFFNVPLDRLFNKMDNIGAAISNETETWQKIFLSLGYAKYQMGIKDKSTTKKKKGRNSKERGTTKRGKTR